MDSTSTPPPDLMLGTSKRASLPNLYLAKTALASPCPRARTLGDPCYALHTLLLPCHHQACACILGQAPPAVTPERASAGERQVGKKQARAGGGSGSTPVTGAFHLPGRRTAGCVRERRAGGAAGRQSRPLGSSKRLEGVDQ